MLVATDASAQSGDVTGIIASANGAGVKVNVLLTGDCGLAAAGSGPLSDAPAREAVVTPLAVSSQIALKRIAQETGGMFFYIPSKDPSLISAALGQVFSKVENPNPADVNADGSVNCADLAAIKALFGRRSGQTGFDARADVNHDGLVDVRDLAIVARSLPLGANCQGT